jgi:flagellar hook-associated protein 1 FlgK
MSLGGALSIASSGLANIAANFSVISQNVANANTPGYAVEAVTTTSLAAAGNGVGVRTGPTTRQIDTQLEADLYTQNGAVSGLQTQQAALQAIDAVQGTPGGGGDLASLLGNLQDAFTSLQTGPDNQAAQSQVVSAAKSLAQQTNALSAAYTQGRQDAQDNIVSDVSTLNATLATIGSLSTQIVEAKAAGQSTGDLENQRAQSMQALSQLVDVRFVGQPDGDLLAATANGVTLPIHSQTAPFSVQPATIGPSSTYPATSPAIELNGVDVTQQITGGALGAEITLRDRTLPTYQAELDEFSETLSTRFQQQGLALFTDPTGNVPSSAGSPAQSGYVGYAATVQVNPAVSATPSLVRDGTDTIAGSASGASAFTPNPAGGPSGFTGLITRILNYTFGADVQHGVTQPAPATTGLGPSGSLAAPFAPPPDLTTFATAVVTAESTDSATATSRVTTEQAVQTALQSKVSASGAVSIDTEMSQMVQLENAYGANAKVISTLQSLWTDLQQMVT